MNTNTLTRRQLAVIATASLVSTKALAQNTPGPDYYQAALESHKRNSAILARFQLAMSVEPAFHFKA